jgi:predicted nuclease with TOPRIM domain
MNEDLKQEGKDFILHYWQFLVILGMIISLVVVWNMREDERKEKESLKNRIQMEGTIKEIEARLEAMHKREAEYEEVYKAQDKLKASIASLEKERRELDKKKKEKLKNEIEKMDTITLSNTFKQLGIPNTIKSSN